MPLSPELQVRTKHFALRIVRTFQALPRTSEAQVIGSQMLRSGTSVAANYRAAIRARSKTEFIAKMGIVVEEADETQFWIELLADAKIVPSMRLSALLQEATELTAIFTTCRQTARGSGR